MSGRGYATPDDLVPIPGVLHFARDLTWREAIEPITKDRPFVGTFAADGTKRVSPDPWDAVPPEAGDRVVGVGPGRTFGRLLRAFAPEDEVGLIPAAVGGTPISAWLPGGVDPHDAANHPYDDAVARARAAQKDGEIVAVLWHQGEGDASLKTPHYDSLLRQVIENFRRDLGLSETVPFIMGTLATFYGDKYPEIVAGADAVEAAFEKVVATTPYVGLVSAFDLPDRGDQLHFSAEAQHMLGERYFRMWKSMTAVSPAKLAMQAEKYRDAPRFRTPILLDPGEFLVTSPFGMRPHPVTGDHETFHAGIDGALWNGRMLLETGICAWRDGVVIEAADTDGPAGTCVAIDHGNGLVSRYFHLERGSLRVAAGDAVREGVVLGWMGKTGRATGEHLHFQLERDGFPIDPLPLLSRPSASATDTPTNRLTDTPTNRQTVKPSNRQTVKPHGEVPSP
jgi:murein DD-endopeptidase MepM/ murein hydrolase activator NlpD